MKFKNIVILSSQNPPLSIWALYFSPINPIQWHSLEVTKKYIFEKKSNSIDNWIWYMMNAKYRMNTHTKNNAYSDLPQNDK